MLGLGTPATVTMHRPDVFSRTRFAGISSLRGPPLWPFELVMHFLVLYAIRPGIISPPTDTLSMSDVGAVNSPAT